MIDYKGIQNAEAARLQLLVDAEFPGVEVTQYDGTIKRAVAGLGFKDLRNPDDPHNFAWVMREFEGEVVTAELVIKRFEDQAANMLWILRDQAKRREAK